jgi:uncharacterized protein (TIGR03435 family)
MNRIVTAAFLLSAALAAQQPAASRKFDVVSVHVVPPDAPPVMRDQDFTPVLPGGQYIDSRTALVFMIDFAYNVKSYLQLVGLPKWAVNQAYAVAAKPAPDFPALPPEENREQVRLMLRAMLEDRFHLQLHTETRKEPIYSLEVAKGGFKIKGVDPPVPPDKEGYVNAAWGDDSIRMIAHKSTMAGLAGVLALMLKTPVVDQTGMKSYYTYDVNWKAPLAPGSPPPGSGFGAEGIALLFANLQSQFGLHLTKTTGSVEYWVVDHVEPPTDN